MRRSLSLVAALLIAPQALFAEMVAGPEDLSGWSVSDARFEAAPDLVRAWPNSDETSSYYVSAPGLRGDYSRLDAIRFELRSGGGTGYRAEGGDLVIRGRLGTIRLDTAHRHGAGWVESRVSVTDADWRLDAGTPSVAAVLSDVVQILIRAEHGDGEDWSELRALHLIERGPAPVDEPAPVPEGKD